MAFILAPSAAVSWRRYLWACCRSIGLVPEPPARLHPFYRTGAWQFHMTDFLTFAEVAETLRVVKAGRYYVDVDHRHH